jgi:hypothetical protein
MNTHAHAKPIHAERAVTMGSVARNSILSVQSLLSVHINRRMWGLRMYKRIGRLTQRTDDRDAEQSRKALLL